MILLLLLSNALVLLFGRDRIAETIRACLCQITALMGAMKNILQTCVSCGSSGGRMAGMAFFP